jgi:hypothetical protein
MEPIHNHSLEELYLLVLEQKLHSLHPRCDETMTPDIEDGRSRSGTVIRQPSPAHRLWQELPPCVKKDWHALAGRQRLDGCALFVNTNGPRLGNGQPLQLVRSCRYHDWLAFSAAPGPDSGEIFVSYTTGRTAHSVVCALKPAGPVDGDTVFDYQVFPAGNGGRQIISGLHPGREYEVHAFIPAIIPARRLVQ